MTDRCIGQLEHNQREIPQADTLQGLARALNVSMEWLWTGVEADDRIARQRATDALAAFDWDDRVSLTDAGRAALAEEAPATV